MDREERYQMALGALADIAYAEDLTEGQRRHKAHRVYQQLIADEQAEHEGEPPAEDREGR